MGMLQIDLLGASFAIKANEDDAYLKKLLGYYTQISSEIEKSGSLKDPLQISILSGIMLCDELYKEKSKTAQFQQKLTQDPGDEAERLTIEMIKKIDKALA